MPPTSPVLWPPTYIWVCPTGHCTSKYTQNLSKVLKILYWILIPLFALLIPKIGFASSLAITSRCIPQIKSSLLSLYYALWILFKHLLITLTNFYWQKQVAQFTKVVSHVWEIISKGREDWEGESMRSAGKHFIISILKHQYCILSFCIVHPL